MYKKNENWRFNASTKRSKTTQKYNDSKEKLAGSIESRSETRSQFIGNKSPNVVMTHAIGYTAIPSVVTTQDLKKIVMGFDSS